MPHVDANGIRQHYEIEGDGSPTIVWIHGIGRSLEDWREVLPQVPGYRHLTYDVRGMGQSEGGDDPPSLPLWADDLAALLDALAIDSAIVAGVSMGGVIAQQVAIRHPGRVEGLVLISTSSRVGPAAEEGWLRRAEQSEAAGRPHVAAAQRAVSSYHLDDDLRGVQVPALVMVGDEDTTTPPGGSVIISRLLERSELEIVKGAGHGLIREDARASECLRRWLADHFDSGR